MSAAFSTNHVSPKVVPLTAKFPLTFTSFLLDQEEAQDIDLAPLLQLDQLDHEEVQDIDTVRVHRASHHCSLRVLPEHVHPWWVETYHSRST